MPGGVVANGCGLTPLANGHVFVRRSLCICDHSTFIIVIITITTITIITIITSHFYLLLITVLYLYTVRYTVLYGPVLVLVLVLYYSTVLTVTSGAEMGLQRVGWRQQLDGNGRSPGSFKRQVDGTGSYE